MKKLKTLTTAIIAVVLFSTTASAQTVKNESAKEPLSVKYVGNEEDYLYFQVEINTDNNFALLQINDIAEGELYSQGLKTSTKFETFKIEKKDGQELNFKLQVGNKIYSKTFSTTTTLKSTTVVNENDIVAL